MKEMWDERFSGEDYIYGKQPNEFFRLQLDKLQHGRLLLAGEGEGRNAVYAASKGWQVDAFDYSEKAREKALKLAEEQNVKISYTVQDLNDFNPGEGLYDAAALIYIHLEEELRQKVHAKVIASLKPGGVLILEAFDKEQLSRSSGGPRDIDLLYSLEDIVNDFNSLEFSTFMKETLVLDEGDKHSGEAVVIRFAGVKLE